MNLELLGIYFPTLKTDIVRLRIKWTEKKGGPTERAEDFWNPYLQDTILEAKNFPKPGWFGIVSHATQTSLTDQEAMPFSKTVRLLSDQELGFEISSILGQTPPPFKWRICLSIATGSWRIRRRELHTCNFLRNIISVHQFGFQYVWHICPCRIPCSF